MLREALIVLLALTVSDVAFANQGCSGTAFGSHAEQIACEMRQTQAELREVDAALDNVKAANARSEKISGIKPELFTGQIDDDQKLWRLWIEKDCRLQGGVTMGTAGADVEQQCLQEGYARRVHELNQIARTLEP